MLKLRSYVALWCLGVFLMLLICGCGESKPSVQQPKNSNTAHVATSTANAQALSVPPHPRPTARPVPTPTPTPLPAAAPGVATTGFQVTTSSYLGSLGNNTLGSVDIAPDGTIFAGGILTGLDAGGDSSNTLLKGGNGTVLHFDKSGQHLLSVTHLGNSVKQVMINSGGLIVACGDFGVAVLDATATNLLWSAQPGSGGRCSIGDDGTVAVLVGSGDGSKLLSGGIAYVYSASGSEIAHWAIGGTSQTDIAVDSLHQQVYATGFTQYGDPVQVAFLRAWNYKGTAVWHDYDFTDPEVNSQGLKSDTRGYRVSVGRDGMVYFAGISSGGTTIYHRDPHNITADLPASQKIAYDLFTNPYNTSSNNITWYGRYNPVDGNLIAGQFLLARIDSKGNKGNTINASSIMADEHGRVYLAGQSCYAIANRGSQSIAGTQVASYAGCEAFLAIMQPDLRQRLIWTVFTAGGPQDSDGASVNVRNGSACLGVTMNTGTLITHNAFQNNPANGYFAVWSQSVE